MFWKEGAKLCVLMRGAAAIKWEYLKEKKLSCLKKIVVLVNSFESKCTLLSIFHNTDEVKTRSLYILKVKL